MDLSVVIPCYNAGEKIVNCINALTPLASSIDIEIIVVDDGSKDNSATLVSQLNLPFVKLIRKENGGVSSARNRGIEAAIGKYLVFADADDWYDANALLEVYKEIAKSNVDLLMFGYNYVTPNRVRKIVLPSTDSIDEIKKQMVDPPFAKRYDSKYLTGRVYQYIYKREALTARFDESLPYAEDLVFVLDCLTSCKSFKKCDIYAYYYVYESGSVTNTYKPNYYTDLKRAYNILIEKGYTKLALSYLYYMDRAMKNYVAKSPEKIRKIMQDKDLKEILENSSFNDWTLKEKWRNNAILSENYFSLKVYYSFWNFSNELRFLLIKIYTKLR